MRSARSSTLVQKRNRIDTSHDPQEYTSSSPAHSTLTTSTCSDLLMYLDLEKSVEESSYRHRIRSETIEHSTTFGCNTECIDEGQESVR